MLRRYSLYLFLVVGLLVQVVTYVLSPGHPISLISGMLGICSVVLGARGNILTFVFGFAQVITYSFLCWQERFYAELLLNVYYFFTMIYGVYVWRKHIPSSSASGLEVRTRKLPMSMLVLIFVGSAILSLIVGWVLQRYTNDTQPYMDAFTTIPALVAQMLMVLVYREQWYIWFAVDVLAAIMWIQAGNYCMAAQYIFWCANCVYGYVQWTRKVEGENSANIVESLTNH